MGRGQRPLTNTVSAGRTASMVVRDHQHGRALLALVAQQQAVAAQRPMSSAAKGSSISSTSGCKHQGARQRGAALHAA